MEQLSQENILVEDWGGPIQCQQISAKTGLNIEELLDKVLLEAEMLDLKANPDKNASGTVVEPHWIRVAVTCVQPLFKRVP